MINIKSLQARIYEIRGERVMLDMDLAALYEVPTKVLNQSVKRNIMRFPEDFMFQLTVIEWQGMWSQIVTTSNNKVMGSQSVITYSRARAGQRPKVMSSRAPLTGLNGYGTSPQTHRLLRDRLAPDRGGYCHRRYCH